MDRLEVFCYLVAYGCLAFTCYSHERFRRTTRNFHQAQIQYLLCLVAEDRVITAARLVDLVDSWRSQAGEDKPTNLDCAEQLGAFVRGYARDALPPDVKTAFTRERPQITGTLEP